MKVKANINYFDKLLNRNVAKDEILDVAEERAKVLLSVEYNGIKFCSEVIEKVEEKAEQPTERKKAKRAKR